MRVPPLSGLRWLTAALTVTYLWAVAPVLVGQSTGPARATDWVAAQRQLPDTLDELRLYPAAYRQQIARALSPAVRLRLWQQYLTRAAAANKELDAKQRAYLFELVRLLTEEDAKWMSKRSSAVNTHLSRAKSVLSGHVSIFRGFTRGPYAFRSVDRLCVADRVRALRVRLGEALHAAVTAHADPSFDCNCLTTNDGMYDNCQNSCGPASYAIPPACRRLSCCCDFMDNQPCDGLCWLRPD